MNDKLKNLYEPITIKGVTFKNRIEASPISTFELATTPEKAFTHYTYGTFRNRASGGASIVTVGDAIVHPMGTDTGYLPSPKIMICNEDSIPFLRHVADEIHRYNCVACIQLNHAGMLHTTAEAEGWGPDDINFDEEGEKYAACLSDQAVDGQIDTRHGIVHYMTEEMIEETVEAFGQCALRAKECHFDMIQLHAAHGWLIHQFMSPLTNHRTDRFGGSLENRARLLMMIIERVRQYCGEDFLIEVRMSGTDYVEDGGYHVDQAVEFAKMMDGKVDIIHVSAGNFVYPETEALLCPTIFKPNGVNVYLAEAIKKEMKVSKVSTIGGINDVNMMEEIISSGKADFVACGRALIADPALPDKGRRGQEEDIRPCIRCTFCLADYQMRTQRCSVNPVFHRPWEAIEGIIPSRNPKKVLIAGGGPAGLEAAMVAAQRGHQVILCEKSGRLGGLIRYAEVVSFKFETAKFMNYLIKQVEKLAVDIRLNTEVTPELVRKIAPDNLIVAIGSDALVPPIPGIEKTIKIMDVYDNNPDVGENVAIIGGGIAGSEYAIECAYADRKATIIEMGSDIARDANPVHKTALMGEFTTYSDKITLMRNTKCVEITDEGVWCETKDGEKTFVKADSVILAAGMKAKLDVVDELRKACDEIVWVGDCKRPRQIRHAVLEAYDAAMNI